MRVFISSLIKGMEEFRAAAKAGVLQLDHEPVMAEDFRAQPQSPQIACLEGLRQAGLVILILGPHYGAKQSSGLSATHEEYREARGSHPVIAFIQADTNYDNDQKAFLKEVQAWEGGLFRGEFSTSEELRTEITRALHRWELSKAAGPLDPDQLRSQASAAIESEHEARYRGVPCLLLSITTGPLQAVLRPSEVEEPLLAKDLLREALFGEYPLFSATVGSKHQIEEDSLVIKQGDDEQLIKLDPQGALLFRLQLQQQKYGAVIIKEQLEQQIFNALKYAAWVLDRIDPTQKLTHVAFAASFTDASSIVIRTQVEHNASPNSYSLGFGQREHKPIFLKPAHRVRATLSNDTEKLSQDLVTLLRRNTGGI